MIKINNLNKNYANLHILKNINLHIKKGDFCVILGASGSGKSTLLKILSGYEKFSSGEIIIENERFNEIVNISKTRQIITQNYCIIPHLNAKNNIKFALKCSGEKDSKIIEQKAKEYLKLVHLENKENAFLGELSGGQAQRVAIARALSLKPNILFLDEPFSALDPITRNHLQNELKTIAKNTTMVFVSHDIDEALKLANIIVVLYNGNIISTISNPQLENNSIAYFELKSKLYNLINGEAEKLEYNI